MSRLERAVGNAVSFPGSSPPEQCRMIGMVEHETMGNVLYYESMTGERFYYITEKGLQFARKMEKTAKQQKRQKNNSGTFGDIPEQGAHVIDTDSNKISIPHENLKSKEN